MNEPRKAPSALELEQWLLEEQTPEQRAKTEARLSAVQREQLRRDDAALRAELFEQTPPADFVSAVRTRAAAVNAPREPRRWALASLLSAAGALTLALFLVLPLAPRNEPSGERAKGLELDLRVYRKLDHGVERLHDGDVVRAHDVLQLAYIRSGYPYGVLLSVDGRGTITLHQPGDTSASSVLPDEQGERLLDQAYELDDAPEFERFVLVVSDRPLVTADVYEAAQRLAVDPARARREPLVLPARTAQRSLLLRKHEHR